MIALLASLVLVFDADERHPFTAVDGRGPAVAYTRDAPGGWTQHWLYSPQNPHDRGILRTGRHAGDWELVQTHPRDGVVVAQHSTAERCGWDEVRPGPTIYVANGSHALYLRPGLRDRTFPDPNDEADGRGARVRPRVVTITETSPSWMRSRRRWGGARARWFVPGESDSPRGPAFQGVRWDDPAAFARSAGPCRAARCDEKGECDGRENALAAGAALLLGGGLVARLRARRRRTG
jgi:hypothetical protein